METGRSWAAMHRVSLGSLVFMVAVGPFLSCCLQPTGGPGSNSGEPSRAGTSAAMGCTAFVLRHGGRILAGKNLDWPVGDGIVLANPRGLEKAGWSNGGETPASWVSRYASVTFNQLGRELPLGGMNEAGLVVEELSYAPARYPPRDGRPAVNELQWIQYQLDTHATVGDVVADTAVRIAPLLFGLHYMVADASGEVAVIEFLDGARVVHVGEAIPVAVLANDTYGNLLRYLGFHVGFGGERVVGPGPESPERFVRAAMAVRRLEGSERPGVTFESAFAVLDDVAQEDTQWSIVYDPVRLEVRYHTRANPRVRSVKLREFSGDCVDAPPGSHIDHPEVPGRAWSPWDSEQNGRLVGGVFDALGLFLDQAPPASVRTAIAAHVGKLRCVHRPQ